MRRSSWRPDDSIGFLRLAQERRVYGKIPWKGLVHDGAHKPIVSNEVLQQVQEFLASHERAKERQRTHVLHVREQLQRQAEVR